ncbi:MAG: hypothetical protein IJ012_02135 [Clostridia bacterium]|nr:hypothetical protein [Clostridia bacterium]
MKKITKEMCTVFIKDHYKSKPIFLIFISIFAPIALWFFTKNIIVVAISAALLLALSILAIYIANQKINNIDLGNFCLVEDVVVAFKKARRSSKSGGAGYDYIYTFKNHGKHTISKSVYPTVEIPLHREKHIRHLPVENLCIQSCEKGDLYYLLITKEKECTKIIQCFPAYHFRIVQEDFDLIDGKYYCKK